jgi:hypothetical protein
MTSALGGVSRGNVGIDMSIWCRYLLNHTMKIIPSHQALSAEAALSYYVWSCAFVRSL